MRALLDTNVLLDAIAAREPFKEDAQRIVLLAAEEKIEGLITANCLTDIYYIARKSLPEAEAREALRSMLQIFSVIDLCGADVEAALDMPMDDYEDAVAVVCARKAAAECIITRDKAFLQSVSKPPVVSPQDFLNKV